MGNKNKNKIKNKKAKNKNAAAARKAKLESEAATVQQIDDKSLLNHNDSVDETCKRDVNDGMNTRQVSNADDSPGGTTTESDTEVLVDPQSSTMSQTDVGRSSGSRSDEVSQPDINNSISGGSVTTNQSDTEVLVGSQSGSMSQSDEGTSSGSRINGVSQADINNSIRDKTDQSDAENTSEWSTSEWEADNEDEGGDGNFTVVVGKNKRRRRFVQQSNVLGASDSNHLSNDALLARQLQRREYGLSSSELSYSESDDQASSNDDRNVPTPGEQNVSALDAWRRYEQNMLRRMRRTWQNTPMPSNRESFIDIVRVEAENNVERIKREEERKIEVQRQNLAYELSLKADMEKKRKKIELERTEKEIIEQKSVLRSGLPECPDGMTGALPLILQSGDGQRIHRTVHEDHPILSLHAFIFCHQDLPDMFEVRHDFPRRRLPCHPAESGSSQTFKEAGVQPRSVLFICVVDEDSD